MTLYRQRAHHVDIHSAITAHVRCLQYSFINFSLFPRIRKGIGAIFKNKFNMMLPTCRKNKMYSLWLACQKDAEDNLKNNEGVIAISEYLIRWIFFSLVWQILTVLEVECDPQEEIEVAGSPMLRENKGTIRGMKIALSESSGNRYFSTWYLTSDETFLPRKRKLPMIGLPKGCWYVN